MTLSLLFKEIKQARRLSFSERVESPASSQIEDFEQPDESEVVVDLLAEPGSSGSRRRRRSPPGSSYSDVDTPSKQRRDGSAAAAGTGGRRALIVLAVAEAVIILGLASSFAWYALWR